MLVHESSGAATADADVAARWCSDWLLGKPWRLSLLLFAWIALAVAGTVAVWHYETTPGESGSPATQWPTGSALVLHPSKHTLLLFAHPKCPCTRASLTAIAEIASSHAATVETQVIFFHPALADATWREADLCREALANARLKVVFDEQRRESNRFGVKTSGHALLFSPSGELRFAGGVTSARGKAGENPGQQRLSATLAGATAKALTSPVFGCPLGAAVPSSSQEGALCPLP